jgi:cation diffusion facilitator CzcD-associated flavoprotein CzcO
MKRIVCRGGGPAGLYAAILFKKALPGASVEVYERNRPDDTFGWGVVFSDKTLQGFRASNPESHDAIVGNFHHWDDVDVHIMSFTQIKLSDYQARNFLWRVEDSVGYVTLNIPERKNPLTFESRKRADGHRSSRANVWRSRRRAWRGGRTFVLRHPRIAHL